MTIHTPSRRAATGARPLAHAAAAAAILLALLIAGCTETVNVPPMDVKVVDAYGVRLDEQATPQQVAYVLLRSLRDDVTAAQAGDRQRQKDAFRVTYSLAAFSEIEKRLLAGLGQSTLGAARQRKIYDVINHWAPIVGHYVRSFDLDEKTAVARMKTASLPDNSAVVLYEVVHDPQATGPADRPVILEITLVREKATAGPQEFIRVARVDFRGLAQRPATRPPATGPAATTPADPTPVGG